MIRQISYGSTEYEACKRLRNKILRKPLGLTLSERDLEGENKQLHIATIDEEGKVQGGVILKSLSEGRMKLRQMVVSPTAQGRGIGAQLVQFAELAAKDKGFVAITTHARSSARGFYEKCGFKVQGKEFMEIGVAHFVMEKTL